MPATVLSDNAYGSLGASLASTASSITFTSGHGARFPAITSTASRAYATILNSNNVLEEITITTHTAGADTADVVRAVGGTTAKAWSSGDRIEMRLSKSALDDLSLNTLTLANGLTVTAGNVVTPVGAGSANIKATGMVSSQTSAAGVGNGADTTDDTLFTYSLPANSLDANGKTVRIHAWGKFAANTNGKTMKSWFGGTGYVPEGDGNGFNNIGWVADMEVTRIDATHVSISVTHLIGVANFAFVSVDPNVVVSDLTANATVIKVTGASGTSTANDIRGYGMTVTFSN